MKSSQQTFIKADINDMRLELWLRKRNAGEILWKTKDGRIIALKDMADEHLLRCIEALREQEQEREIVEENRGDA